MSTDDNGKVAAKAGRRRLEARLKGILGRRCPPSDTKPAVGLAVHPDGETILCRVAIQHGVVVTGVPPQGQDLEETVVRMVEQAMFRIVGRVLEWTAYAKGACPLCWTELEMPLLGPNQQPALEAIHCPKCNWRPEVPAEGIVKPS